MQVLFVCPHGAAKSVVGAALLRDLSDQRNLDLTVSNRGTEPDDALNPSALAAIQSRGLDHTEAPSLLTSRDIELADVVVSIGCTVEELPSRPDHLVEWSNVPDFSSDPDLALDTLAHLITELADWIASRERWLTAVRTSRV